MRSERDALERNGSRPANVSLSLESGKSLQHKLLSRTGVRNEQCFVALLAQMKVAHGQCVLRICSTQIPLDTAQIDQELPVCVGYCASPLSDLRPRRPFWAKGRHEPSLVDQDADRHAG